MNKTIAAVCGNIVERVTDFDLPIELDLSMLNTSIRKHGEAVASPKVMRLFGQLDRAVTNHDGNWQSPEILSAVVSLTYAIREGSGVAK